MGTLTRFAWALFRFDRILKGSPRTVAEIDEWCAYHQKMGRTVTRRLIRSEVGFFYLYEAWFVKEV